MSKYKYGLILDTNVFIHLSQQNYYQPYIYDTFLHSMIFSPNTLFIIPEQVQIEWKRLIEEKMEALVEKEKKPLVDALKLTKHLDNQEQVNNYQDAINQALKIKDRIHKYIFQERVKFINSLLFDESFPFGSDKEKVERTAGIDKLLVNLSLNHSAPFFGNDRGKGKINEMADALIFFSACEFAKNNSELCDAYIFITDETNFSQGPELHKNIKGYAEEANLNFYCSFKTFIDSELSIVAEEYKQNAEDNPLFLSDKYFKTCNECKGEVHIHKDVYPKRDFWYYVCECGNEWHEFETVDL